MKKLIFLIAMLIPVGVYSQISVRPESPPIPSLKYEIIDRSVLRVFYETLSISDPSKPEVVRNDYQVLEIGENGISRFCSDDRRREDSIMAEVMKSGNRLNAEKAFKDSGVSFGGNKQHVFKNYPLKKITVTDQIAIRNCLYEEDMVEFQWQILSETKTILSYSCQKATTDFRGRHYEAWFAPDLPINDGPWKFGGLPGLILAVADSAKNYSFLAVGIENATSPIYFLERDHIKASRTEINKIDKQYCADPAGYLSNTMPGSKPGIVVDESGNLLTKIPYNPMELE
jgi:GLPGLI family protein